MIRKQLAVILACAMVFCMLTSFCSIAMAAAETLISDRAGLASITGSGSYRLTADIDLAGEDWEPLAAFSGTLDGGGHVIRNLSITNTNKNNNGLFASISAGGQVVNLGIESANITAGNNTGGIAGTNNGFISCCYTTGTVSGDEYVGGLVGKNLGKIENCYSRAAVSGKEHWGGLAGSNSGTIETSYAASNVSDSVMNNFLEFKSENDKDGGGYIDIPHQDAYRVNAFTLEAWFQWDKSNIEADNVEFIVGKDFEHFEIHTEGGSGPNGIRFIPIPNPKVDGYGASSGYGGYEKDSWIDVHNVLQPGWFHVAAVYSYDVNNVTKTDNIEIQVYVNGEAQELFQVPEDGSAARSVGTTATLSRNSNPLAAITNDAGLGIGWRRESKGYFFNGKIADVRLWNTARTEAEIRANKDRVLTGNEDGLVGYWKLNEASGTTAIDSSSTQNNGILTNVGTGGSVTRTILPASTNKGALTASNTGTFTNCFYDSALYGSDSGDDGTAKSTGDMKTQSTFNGWDFDIWSFNTNNDGYPSFRAKAVTVNGGTADKFFAIDGETVTITAGTPTTGKRFKAWTGIDGLTFTDSTDKSSVAKFTMPTHAVTVTATYENIPRTRPTITMQPNDPIVKAGQTATFTVAAIGYPAPTYQWWMNDGKGWTEIQGATSASYTTGATTLSNSGKKYRCYIENSVGNVTSDEATLTVTNENVPQSGNNGGSVVIEEMVYNAPNIPQATIWLTGNDFADNDRLVTETLTSGESYNAMLRLAEGGKVFKAYNISLESGMKPSGSAMHINFDLAKTYAGKTFTLVHAKDNGTYEYFHATADENGDLTFGPLYTLSPFMLVEGALFGSSAHDEVDVPKTGDGLLPVLCTAFMLMAGAVLTAGFAKTKKKSSR